MQYTDLEIHFLPANEPGVFDVRATSRHVGPVTQRLTLPFSLEAFERELPALRENRLPLDSPLHPDRLGSDLFQALFHGDLYRCYEETKRKAAGKLRIKLYDLGGEPGLEPIARVPWELMRQPNDPIPLIVSLQTPIVRYLKVDPKITGVIPFPKQLRVLVVCPNAKGFVPIDPETTLFSLEKTLGPNAVHLLKKPTRQGLRRALASKAYHILHFTTHGGFNSEKNQGHLVLEKENGEKDRVSAGNFATMLRAACGSLRLVSLFACNSGKTSMNARTDPYGGVASALIHSGVPAVLAMQFNVTLVGSIRFMEDFYWAIAAGEPVDTAAGLARNRLCSLHLPKVDWATPVLYMSAPQGRLFSKTNTLHINSILDGLNPDDDEEYEDLSRVFRGNFMKGFHLNEHPRSWNTKILPLLKRLKTYVNPEVPINFRGKSRIPIWVALGYIFAGPSSVTVRISQKNEAAETKTDDEIWGSDEKPESKEFEVKPTRGHDDGKDMVVSLSISNSIDKDVEKYLTNHKISWKQWLRIRVLPKPGRDALKNAGQALGLARDIAQAIREKGGELGAVRVRLFLSCPSAFALFLGMQLNACRTVYVYEWDREKYFRTFLLK